ncbi:bifunctional transcriptional activator/DNA repair enzyme AdaA [Consotaella aegiceratis]|uniref:bifunctional transcriptional activator/DNA repair enzyme AdaA n=1 Tax=Consotaella aegiceratis TaxID=3097961 RepID=UPI002F3F3F00
MLFTASTNDDTLYRALLERDGAYDGLAFVGVTSTRIFCRFTCPARKPKRQHCRFFETAQACVDAGFRPCKRCRPLLPEAAPDPVITALLEDLGRRPTHRWSEADIQALGFDLSTVRRAFKRQFGMTFLELARYRRLGDAIQTLGKGGKVIEAQIDARFESPSAFRSAVARLLGLSPGDFVRNALLLVDWIDTPLGPMIVVGDRRSVHLLEFVDRKALATELRGLRDRSNGSLGFGRPEPADRIAEELSRFFAGEDAAFTTPLTLHGSPFARQVWRALQEIPAGTTRSYGDLARAIGRPTAVRAVARANGANQIALVIPCHRVIGADGSLTGYGGGLWRKQRLIEIERSYRDRTDSRGAASA